MKILIVDDKPENLYLLRALLTGHGHEVDEARHGAEALVKARQHPPALVISDLLMPVMDGYTLLRHWKADPRLRAIPFVVYTATYTEPKDEQLALDLGADAFLLKPAEPDAFMARLAVVLAQKESGALTPPQQPAGEEKVLLKEYSEVLIRKLEEKSLQLEQANRELADREARLRAIFDTEPECVKLLDADGSLLEMNPAGLRLIEADSFQQVGHRCVYPLVVEEHRAAFKALTEKVFAGESGVLEFQITGLKGTRRWLEMHASPLRAASGEVTALLGITRDITARKQAEAALRESETRSRIIAELVSDYAYIFHVTPEGQLIGEWVTDAFTKVFGLTLPEIDARGGWQRLVHPEDLPLALAHAQKVAGGESDVCEMRWRTATGEVRWLRDYARPVFDESGKRVVRIYGASQDITAQKQAEAHILQLYRTLTVLSDINQLIVRERDEQALLDGACRIAVEQGGFLMACVALPTAAQGRLAVAAHAGATPATVVALNQVFDDPALGCEFSAHAFTAGTRAVCNDVATDPRAAPWREAALQRGYRSMAAFPLLAAGRHVGVFNLYAATAGFFDDEELKLLDELAADLGFALETRQIERARQRAEAALRASEEHFRLLIEHASDMVGVINHAGVIRYLSPSTERHMGWRAQDMLGRSAFDLVHPDDTAKVAAALQQAIAQPGTPVAVEYRLRRADGQWRAVVTLGRNVPGQSEEGFIVLNTRDVTEQRQLAEQLRQSQKLEAIGQLAGGVAHDFNNLLAVILMQTELLALEKGMAAEVLDGLQPIRAAAERAANLTRQLLLFSRREVMQPRNLDLNEVVTSLAKMLQRIIGEDVRLQLDLHPKPLWLHADAGMLDQVLMNLAVNARDAMPGGGHLRIETAECLVDEAQAQSRPEARPGRYARLRVSDTGSGIPPEILPRIFEPFFTTKEPGKGTGLGLATVFGIVQQHGGWIEVQSEPGRGTTFDILLPALAAAAAAQTAAARPQSRGGTETILLVEDDATVRQLTRVVLERAGYRVLEAANGVEAERLWQQAAGPVHLLLTDLVMPEGVSGTELAAKLRASQPGLRVVYCSGYRAETAGGSLELRAGERFLQKPFPPNALLETVRQCLDG